ncbi:MAG TPA: hypothetical protein DIT05_01835 [Morganella sp. (in: Bacteria)]|nr:hypothetical protein [Morganella sp. (in: enterobacteria)]
MFGWKKANFSNYLEAYNLYGGGLSTSPEILNFLHQRYDLNEKYYIRHNKERITAAICVWNNQFLAGDPDAYHKIGIEHPLYTDEIIFPFQEDEKSFIFLKSKYISPLHQRNIINTAHTINAHRKICLVKAVSSKTKSSRNRELNRFLKNEGSVVSMNDVSTSDFVDLYDELYFMRRSEHQNKQILADILNEIPSLKFGNVLFYKNSPAAVQFVIKKQTIDKIYFNFVNTGRRMDIDDIPIGTIAMWVNVKDAISLCEEKKLEMRFSFGRPTFEYKMRWCDTHKLYRTLSI